MYSFSIPHLKRTGTLHSASSPREINGGSNMTAKKSNVFNMYEFLYTFFLGRWLRIWSKKSRNCRPKNRISQKNFGMEIHGNRTWWVVASSSKWLEGDEYCLGWNRFIIVSNPPFIRNVLFLKHEAPNFHTIPVNM